MKRLFEFAGYSVPDHLKLFQMTDNPDVPGCHIYMEAQIFSPDSKRMVLHRSAHPHGSDPLDPEHQYFLCDFENDGTLTDLTDECGVTAPSLSPDGNVFYYFLDELSSKGRVVLKKPDLKTGKCEERGVIESDGTFAPAYFFYPLSTISSDGKRIAIATGLRKKDSQEWPEHGLWVIDVETGEYRLILHGEEFCNLHLQYCRAKEEPHAILIQHNHGSRLLYKTEGAKSGIGKGHVAALDPDSDFALRKIRKSDDPNADNTGFGLDLHIISDDGSGWKTLPVGRDGIEFCQGHQCWRGESTRVIASTLLFDTPLTATQELVEMESFPGNVHCRNNSAGGKRNILSRKVIPAHFLHFATDRSGSRIVSDYESDDGEWHLYTGKLGAMGDAADLHFTLNLGRREKSPWHPHPFLSPDGRKAFINSSASGQLQAYCLELE